jgi:hypothetical protein
MRFHDREKKSQFDDLVRSRKPAVAKPRLAIELIPACQSNLNLRFALARAEWRQLSRRVIHAANGACQICDTSTDELECHESWTFDDKKKTQTLVALIALCHLCHLAKHIGQQEWAGIDYDDAEAHLGRVNGWTPRATRAYVKQAWAQYDKRARRSYYVDLSYVRQFDLVPRPFYESTLLGSKEDHEVSSLARLASEESRREEWIAIYRTRHACFEVATVEPCTDLREEIELLVSSFAGMRHCHGTLIRLYGKGATESDILNDLRAWIARRDRRARTKPERQQ